MQDRPPHDYCKRKRPPPPMPDEDNAIGTSRPAAFSARRGESQARIAYTTIYCDRWTPLIAGLGKGESARGSASWPMALSQPEAVLHNKSLEQTATIPTGTASLGRVTVGAGATRGGSSTLCYVDERISNGHER